MFLPNSDTNLACGQIIFSIPHISFNSDISS